MKKYFKGIFVLGMIIVSLLLTLLFGKKTLSNAQSALFEAKTRSASNQVSDALMKESLLANYQIINTLNGFSESWRKFLEKGTDPNKVLNDLVELSFENTVAVSGKSAQRSQFTEKGIVMDSISLSIKVVGKFERIYAWLGAVEEAYPYAKINQLELMAENMNAALTLGMQLPIIH